MDRRVFVAEAEKHESALEVGTSRIQKGSEVEYGDPGYLWDAVQSLGDGEALVIWTKQKPVEVPRSGRFYVVNGKVMAATEVAGRTDGVVTTVEIQMKQEDYPR